MEDKNNKLDPTYTPISLVGVMTSPEMWDELPLDKLEAGKAITMRWARQWIMSVFNQFGMEYVVEEHTDEDSTSKIVKFRVTNFLPGTDTRYGILLQSLEDDSTILEGLGVYHRFGASMLHSAFKDSDRDLSADDKKELESVYYGNCSFYIPDWVAKFSPDGEKPTDKYGELCLWLKVIMAVKTFLHVVYTDLRTLALRDCQDQLLYLTKSISFHPADFDKLDELLNKNSEQIINAANDIVASADDALAEIKAALQKEESKEDNSENESEQA